MNVRDMKPGDRLVVQRDQDDAPWEGKLLGALITRLPNPRDPDGDPVIGPMLGLLVQDDRGFEFFAQPEQVLRKVA